MREWTKLGEFDALKPRHLKQSALHKQQVGQCFGPQKMDSGGAAKVGKSVDEQIEQITAK